MFAHVTLNADNSEDTAFNFFKLNLIKSDLIYQRFSQIT